MSRRRRKGQEMYRDNRRLSDETHLPIEEASEMASEIGRILRLHKSHIEVDDVDELINYGTIRGRTI